MRLILFMSAANYLVVGGLAAWLVVSGKYPDVFTAEMQLAAEPLFVMAFLYFILVSGLASFVFAVFAAISLFRRERLSVQVLMMNLVYFGFYWLFLIRLGKIG